MRGDRVGVMVRGGRVRHASPTWLLYPLCLLQFIIPKCNAYLHICLTGHLDLPYLPGLGSYKRLTSSWPIGGVNKV